MTFSPILKKKQSSKKKKFFFAGWDFHSVTTHTSYMKTIYFCIVFLLQCFDGKSISKSLFVFLLTKNDTIVYYNKFPNLGVYHAKFPNLKGPRAPSHNCQKIPWMKFRIKNFTTTQLPGLQIGSSLNRIWRYSCDANINHLWYNTTNGLYLHDSLELYRDR